MSNNEVILKCIRNGLSEISIHRLSLKKMVLYLQNHLPLSQKVPSYATILKILHEIFHLKFKANSTASIRYLDPVYNEKRLWVSRLLTWFMMQDMLVISIDESNFRTDAMIKRTWKFAPKS